MSQYYSTRYTDNTTPTKQRTSESVLPSSPPLPRLPPLRTNGTITGGNTYSNNNTIPNVSTTDSPQNRGNSRNSWYRRRPPPPPLQIPLQSIPDVIQDVPDVPDVPSLPELSPEVRSRAHVVHTSPEEYGSPFVGEIDTDSGNKENKNNNIATPKSHRRSSEIYRSPFIGDTGLDISVETSQKQTAFPTVRSPSIFANKPLPELPTQEEYSSETLVDDEELDFFNNFPPQMIFTHHSPLSPSFPSPSPSPSPFMRKTSDSTENYRYYSDTNYIFNSNNASSLGHTSFNSVFGAKPLDAAPNINAPTQPFNIDFLDENKLYQCYSVYKLSDIYEWLLKIYFEWYNEFVFGKIEIYQVIQRLLEFQLPKNFNQETIDSNVDRIVSSLLHQSALRFNYYYNDNNDNGNDNDNDNDMAIVIAGLDIQGILTELLPCYSCSDTGTYSESCYTYSCRRLHAINTGVRKQLKVADIIKKPLGLWTDYWHITAEELAEINPREVQRQSYIFDLLVLEERSLNMANAAVEIYGKRFKPSLLPDVPEFDKLAFKIFEPMIQLHREYIIIPIFDKIQTRGKFIDGVGRIYAKWCTEAHDIYIDYSKAMAVVHEIIMWEKKHGTRFAKWLNAVDNSPEITRTKTYHDVIFFGGYIKSLQNMTVTLNSILKCTEPSMEDYEYLKAVIVDIERLSAEVDTVHGEAIDHQKLVRFANELILDGKATSAPYGGNVYSNGKGRGSDDNNNDNGNEHPGSNDRLNLGLHDPRRKLFMSGLVEKKRDLWIEPAPVFIALLDNYFLVTEVVTNNNEKKYRLVERPIPIDYLSLEKKMSHNESKRLSVPRFAAATSTTATTTGTTTTPTTFVSTSNVTSSPERIGRAGLYNAQPSESELSFKIRNTATNESFTFITSNLTEKEMWIKSITKSLRYQRGFSGASRGRLLNFKVVTSQFAYLDREAPVNLPVAPEGSELDRALKAYQNDNIDNPVVLREPIATAIKVSESIDYEGKRYVLVATTGGIYIKLADKMEKRFFKIMQCSDVTAMEYVSKLGLLFVLNGRMLSYFSVASILSAYYDPQRYLVDGYLVGILLRDKVGYFKFANDFGNSKQLIYERKGKIFVLTPEFDPLTRQFKYFKEYKEYRLPDTSVGLVKIEVDYIATFKDSIVVCTSKGTYLYNEAFNDDGINLPSFLNDRPMFEYFNAFHFGGHPFKSKPEASTKKNSLSREVTAEYVKKDIATNKTRPIACFKLEYSAKPTFLMVYDEAVVRLDRYGQIPNWKEDILVLDFYCTGAALYKGFLILVGDSLIQIYDLTSLDYPLGRTVPTQIIKAKKVLLISSGGRNNFVVSLSHPNIANRQLLLTCECNELTTG